MAGRCEQGCAGGRHVNEDAESKLVPLDYQLRVIDPDVTHQNSAFPPVLPSSKDELVDHSHHIALDADSGTSSPENLPLLAQSHQHRYVMGSVPATTVFPEHNVVQRNTTCTWLSSILSYIRICYRWMLAFAALALYAFFLMPGILRVAWLYFFDKRIHRNIAYGPGPRNKLDLYLPENLGTPKPVIAFVTGGAWIIGYKAWGSLLGLQLVDEDVIVACIDYRNYPQGTIGDMVEDVSQGISFIFNNIASYGGDLNRLFLVGQSAGAHIAACVLIEQAKKEMDRGDVEIANQEHEGNDTSLAWKASQFQAYIGLSGGYNLFNLMDHFHRRGFCERFFLSIMEGEGSLLRYSPELRLQSLGANARFLLPPIFLLHGDHDSSIPCDSSTSFAEALTSVGVQATAKIYEGKTHTDLFLQDPMRGGCDPVLTDILVILYGENRMHSKDASSGPRRRMVPELCLQIAHIISPF